MRFMIPLFVCCLFFMEYENMLHAAPSSASGLPVLPVPLKVRKTSGYFVLTSETTIVCDSKEGEKTAGLFASRLRKSTGYALQLHSNKSASGSNVIIFRLDNDCSIETPDGYRLEITPERIILSSATPAGLYYASVTLMQLFPPEIFSDTGAGPDIDWKAPCAVIEDAPRFYWRGMHLDPVRHFIPFNDLLKMVDVMSTQKLNILHLHLTDNQGWRIEIEAYPELTSIGAKGDRSNPGKGKPLFYTKKQIRELIKYAADRFVTVVPEIDVPGHCGAVYRAYPELCLDKETLNILIPEAEKFVKTVFHEIAAMFPGKWVHFGGDEVNVKHWRGNRKISSFMKENRIRNPHALLNQFYRKVAEIIIAEGKTPVGWDEIATAGVNRKSVVMWWRADSPGNIKTAVEDGYRTVLVPNNPFYFNFSEVDYERGAPWKAGTNSVKEIYSFDPLPPASGNLHKQILGIEFCLWSEFIENTKILQYMAFPRSAVLAEVAWSARSRMNYADMLKRLEVQKKRFAAMNVNYRKGYTLYKLGIIKASAGNIEPAVFKLDKNIIAGKGTYLLRIAQKQHRRSCSGLKVEILADGKVVAECAEKTVSGSRRKWPKWLADYILTLNSFSSAVEYSVRITSGKGEGEYELFFARVQPEGFGPVNWP